jgi:hypothetical protein
VLGTRACAIGLDLAAPVLEVARRGFSSTFSNQMGQLGGWISTTVGADQLHHVPVLHLCDDLAGTLADRHMVDGERVSIGVAAPGWLGWCDRYHVARLIDPTGSCQLVWASSPVVAAFGTSLAGESPLDAELVVAIDLDLGISAAVVSVDRTGVRELVAASAPPTWASQPTAVAAVIAEVAALARDAGLVGANRVVLISDGAGSTESIEQTMRALDQSWAECPVDLVRSRADIARAAVALADMESFEIVGAAPRAVGVLLDDVEQGRSSVHVVVPRNAPTPIRSTATFDLGPDDGADVYLDVYEEQLDEHPTADRAADHRGHRLVMTARLGDPGVIEPSDHGTRAERPDEIDLSFVVGTNGVLRLEPARVGTAPEWTYTWAASRLVVSSTASTDVPAGPLAPPPSSVAARPAPPSLQIAPSSPRSTQAAPGRQRMREMSPPLGLPEALGRAERIVSRQVGRLVAIRSAMALVGSGDRDAPEVLRERADRLDRVLSLCESDDACRALTGALEVARRAIDGPAGRVFAGGTFQDVARELERVIEHLTVVIGAVTPAERNRLVLDGQLMGLDHDRARLLVDELINDAGVDNDGRPAELRDLSAIVVVSATGFSLAPTDVRLDYDQAAIRVLLFDS